MTVMVVAADFMCGYTAVNNSGLENHRMQNRYIAYFIKDYWVELEFEEDEIEVFYLPER